MVYVDPGLGAGSPSEDAIAVLIADMPGWAVVVVAADYPSGGDVAAEELVMLLDVQGVLYISPNEVGSEAAALPQGEVDEAVSHLIEVYNGGGDDLEAIAAFTEALSPARAPAANSQDSLNSAASQLAPTSVPVGDASEDGGGGNSGLVIAVVVLIGLAAARAAFSRRGRGSGADEPVHRMILISQESDVTVEQIRRTFRQGTGAWNVEEVQGESPSNFIVSKGYGSTHRRGAEHSLTLSSTPGPATVSLDPEPLHQGLEFRDPGPLRHHVTARQQPGLDVRQQRGGTVELCFGDAFGVGSSANGCR